MLKRMRIGLVVTGGVDRSGRERMLPGMVWLIERLARRHDVHVFVLHHYREPCVYPLAGATIHDLGRVDGPPGFRRLIVRHRLAAAIEALSAGRRFDLLHAYQGMSGVAATAAGRRLSLPVVVTIDSGELVAFEDIHYGLQRRWIDRRAIGRALRAAARVTVTTETMKRMAAALVSGVRVDVVPIGVDPSAFPPAGGRSGPPFRLLRVGSVNRVKDYPTLLAALGRIVTSLPDLHLDIVGEDTLDGSMQRQAQVLGLESYVTFHGFQPTDALAAFYTRADLHVVSSRHEAAGGVVLEAACAGLPTVGTRVGYLADWSLDAAGDGRERAVAVAVGDAGALATAAIGLLRDAPRRERIAVAARAWALAHDADWTARRFEEIYAEVARPSWRRT
jgi:glycosyltransferase involved in cell wall biosynthesis